MALYAIGDIQGCYDSLLKLLEKIGFSESEDELWCCGDLVNRGSRSLETLRFIRELGDNAQTVLGNHDLHLIAVATGVQQSGKRDTLQAILKAPDRKDLMDWLVARPLAISHVDLNYFMVHAGVYPKWSLEQTLRYAGEVENKLQSETAGEFLQKMYGNKPNKWHAELQDFDRLRFITNSLTRMRYLHEDDKLDMKQKGVPGSQPKELTPWFEKPNKDWNKKIVFGHWSTLGVLQTEKVIALDGGCLWGGKLAAAKLQTEAVEIISIPCAAQQQPNS